MLASGLQNPGLSPLVLLAAGVGVGMASGAFNGVLRRVPAHAADRRDARHHVHPAGRHAADHGEARRHRWRRRSSDLLIGDAVPNALPKPIVLLAIVLLLWAWLERSDPGSRIYADRERLRVGARSVGVSHAGGAVPRLRDRRRLLWPRRRVHQRQTGSADPLIGNPILLQMFAAVVVGGTQLGGGRGGALGSVFGAYMLMMVVNILLVLNVSAYYSTVAEGSILILAVLGDRPRYELGPRPPPSLSSVARYARGAGLLPASSERPPKRLTASGGPRGADSEVRPGPELPGPQRGGDQIFAARVFVLHRSSSSPRKSCSSGMR